MYIIDKKKLFLLLKDGAKWNEKNELLKFFLVILVLTSKVQYSKVQDSKVWDSKVQDSKVQNWKVWDSKVHFALWTEESGTQKFITEKSGIEKFRT